MRCSYAGHRSSTYLKRIMETFKSSDTIGYACTIQEKYFTRLRWLIARLHALVRLTTRVSWMVNSDGWDVISSIVHVASCSIPLLFRGRGVAHQNDVEDSSSISTDDAFLQRGRGCPSEWRHDISVISNDDAFFQRGRGCPPEWHRGAFRDQYWRRSVGANGHLHHLHHAVRCVHTQVDFLRLL